LCIHIPHNTTTIILEDETKKYQTIKGGTKQKKKRASHE
jgi:hypothetical protein